MNNPFGDNLELVVYTDGSCNKYATKAGIGVYFRNKKVFPNYFFEDIAIPLAPPLTNNRAELSAIFHVVNTCQRLSFG